MGVESKPFADSLDEDRAKLRDNNDDEQPVPRQSQGNQDRSKAIQPAAPSPKRDDVAAREDQSQAPSESRHSKRLKDRRADVSKTLYRNPRAGEPNQGDGEHQDQTRPGLVPRRPRVRVVPPLRIPKRDDRQRQVGPRGEPLGHPPKEGQHVLGTLKLDGQKPELLGREPLANRAERPEIQDQAGDDRQTARRPRQNRQPPRGRRPAAPERPRNPASREDQGELQAD